MALDIEQEITTLRKLPDIGQFLGRALNRIQDAVNGLGKNLASDATGTLPAPPQIQQLTVKTNGTGLVHAVISDSNPIQKNLHYFVEFANEPSFLQPHVVHLGVSRSMNPITLPAMDDNGKPQNFYWRAYSQYLGSHPSSPQNFGGAAPMAVSPGGTQQMTLIPSTGSGTAQNSGQEGASGFGKILQRASAGPKRNVQ